MKRIGKVLLVVILVAGIVSFFIPYIKQKEKRIPNTFNNTISAFFKPKNWVRWNSAVRAAWQKDSTSCQFLEDTAAHTATVIIPGKKIVVYQSTALNYRIEDTTGGSTGQIALSIAPDFLGLSSHNDSDTEDGNMSFSGIKIGHLQPCMIAYAWNSRWLYRWLPFFEGHSAAEGTLSELTGYLANPDRYYGIHIAIRPVTDSLFVTLKRTAPVQQLFKELPLVFDSLDQYGRQYKLAPTNRNLAFLAMTGDTAAILAGVNIDRRIEGDYLYKYMQFPGNQLMATAYFEGRFDDRANAYRALQQYLHDHALATQGVCFEKYLSPLPVSDSSIVKVELSYPLHFPI